MKTDKLMTVAFSKGEVHGKHKSGLISLTDLFNVGNQYRMEEGKRPANITHFINSSATQDFIQVLCKNQHRSEDEVVVKSGRGKSAQTLVNLHLAIYAAEYLSTQFHYEVIDTFVNNKLFQYRDFGGDEFIALNMAIDDYLPGRDGMDNRGIYINAAKMLREKILGKSAETKDWDSANADQLRDRYVKEAQLKTFLQMGLITDWNHLKSVIAKL